MLRTFKSRCLTSLVLLSAMMAVSRVQDGWLASWAQSFTWLVAKTSGLPLHWTGLGVAIATAVVLAILVGIFGRLVVAVLFIAAVWFVATFDLGPVDDWFSQLAHRAANNPYRLREVQPIFDLLHYGFVALVALLLFGCCWGYSRYRGNRLGVIRTRRA